MTWRGMRTHKQHQTDYAEGGLDGNDDDDNDDDDNDDGGGSGHNDDDDGSHDGDNNGGCGGRGGHNRMRKGRELKDEWQRRGKESKNLSGAGICELEVLSLH